MNTRWLVPCLLTLICACYTQTQDLSHSEELKLAKQVCSNEKVRITKVDQMKRVIWFASQDPKLCHNDYQAALNELDAILATLDGEICSDQHIDLISHYHFRFIAPPQRMNVRPKDGKEMRKIVQHQLHPEPRKYTITLSEDGQLLMIPIALRHFFLAYVLQVSGLCKRFLLTELSSVKPKSTSDQSIVGLIMGDSALRQLSRDDLSSINFDNVIYLPELEGHSELVDGSEMKVTRKQVHMITSVTEGTALYDLMIDCRNHLRPIYSTLMMPLIKLTKLGYDYLGDKLTKEQIDQLQGSHMKSWLTIVHVCELFNSMIVERDGLIMESDDEVDSDDDDDDDDDDEEDEVTEQFAGTDSKQVDAFSREDKDGSFHVLTDEQTEKLNNAKEADLPEPEAYQPSVKVEPFGNDLWITKERQLDLELSRKPGNRKPFGWRGFMRKTSNRLKKFFSKLDFMRFAHYRRNSEWYSGVLNFISSCSNVASISVTIAFTIISLV